MGLCSRTGQFRPHLGHSIQIKMRSCGPSVFVKCHFTCDALSLADLSQATIARIQGMPEKAEQKNGHRRGGVTISGLMKLKDLSMLDPIGLSRLGRTVL